MKCSSCHKTIQKKFANGDGTMHRECETFMYGRKQQRIGMARLCSDIIITATEGGINYWAEPVRRVRELGSEESDDPTFTAFTMVPADGEVGWGVPGKSDGELSVTAGDIWKALVLLKDDLKLLPARKDLRAMFHEVFLRMEDEGGMIDGEAADILVQVAVFGSLIYG